MSINYGYEGDDILSVNYEAHPLRTLIGVGGNLYDRFDLEKERSQMWTE